MAEHLETSVDMDTLIHLAKKGIFKRTVIRAVIRADFKNMLEDNCEYGTKNGVMTIYQKLAKRYGIKLRTVRLICNS